MSVDGLAPLGARTSADMLEKRQWNPESFHDANLFVIGDTGSCGNGNQ